MEWEFWSIEVNIYTFALEYLEHDTNVSLNVHIKYSQTTSSSRLIGQHSPFLLAGTPQCHSVAQVGTPKKRRWGSLTRGSLLLWHYPHAALDHGFPFFLLVGLYVLGRHPVDQTK